MLRLVLGVFCTSARACVCCARHPLRALHKIGPPLSPVWQLEAVLVAETPLAHNHLIVVTCSGWWGALAAGQRGDSCIDSSWAATPRLRLCDACLKHSPNCASGSCCSAGRAIAAQHTPLTSPCPSSRKLQLAAKKRLEPVPPLPAAAASACNAADAVLVTAAAAAAGILRPHAQHEHHAIWQVEAAAVLQPAGGQGG